jgi:hypothetical protein
VESLKSDGAALADFTMMKIQFVVSGTKGASGAGSIEARNERPKKEK